MADKARIAVLISGGGTNLQAIIDGVNSGLLAHVEIALVVSNKAKAGGIERAQKAGIETRVILGEDSQTAQGVRAAFESKLLQLLAAYEIDLVVLAGFMAILSAEFIAACPCEIVNIHPSLIPAFSGEGFYGLRVHRAALEAGVKVSGATVHLVNEVCDGGRILEQGTVRVDDDDTPQSLQGRILKEVEHVIYPRTIERLSSQIVQSRAGKPQPPTQMSAADSLS